MILLILLIVAIALIAIDSTKNRIPRAATIKSLQALEKEKAKQEKEIARIQAKQEKQQQQKQQALQDIPFYDIQLERLYISAADTRNQYRKALESVKLDTELNRLTDGKAVKEKVVNQHITDRDKALKKLVILENQIHALEKKKAAAETILARE